MKTKTQNSREKKKQQTGTATTDGQNEYTLIVSGGFEQMVNCFEGSRNGTNSKICNILSKPQNMGKK